MSIFDPVKVKSALLNDAAYLASLRYLTGRIALEIGEDRYLIAVTDGALVDVRPATADEKADATLSGPTESWERLLQPVPPPGCQSPLYSDGRLGLSYTGDIVEAAGPFARSIRELHRIMRELAGVAPPVTTLPEVDRDFDAAVGRYMYLRIEGVQYRIYFEEAGHGSIPLLVQHTAGADSRQARHLLEDPDFQEHFRIISYDMPFHGRSLPPTSHAWWDDKYKLTKSFLTDLVLGIMDKLQLDRPVFMGSAMGGMLALDLAYEHPDKFRAVVALNAGPPADFDPSVMAIMGLFSHPRLSPQWMSTIMMANAAATSPEIFRRELGWVYSQAAPGIPEGALHYYAHDHVLTPEQAATIDTDQVAVYLFTGEDDIMGNDFGTDLLVEKMNMVPYKRLRRLGHFGSAENPQAFKEDIWPALAEIVERSAARPEVAAPA